MKTITFKANHNREIQEFIYRFEEKINKGSEKLIFSINSFRIKTLHKSNLIIILYFTGLIILFDSCAFTWIGRSVGGDLGRPSFSDYSNGRIVKVSSENINYGGRNHTEVHMTDSTVFIGIFKGFTIVPNEKNNPYKNRFADSLSCLANFPHTNDLWFTRISNKSVYNTAWGHFDGIYQDGIGLKIGKRYHSLPPEKIISFNNSEETEFDFPVPIGLNDLNQEQNRNGVLIQLDKGQKIIIHVHEIAYARCQRGERSGKFIGTALGVLIDAAIIMVKSRDEMIGIKTILDF